MDGAEAGPGRLRRIARWVPVALLLFSQAAAWGAMFSGGIRGVVAWLLLLSLVPLLGGASVLVAGVYAARRRRLSVPVVGTLSLGLLALWPGAWNFGLLAVRYPASVESTGPSATVRLPSNGSLRVAWGGDRLATNYHAATPDQRWAYDLVGEPCFTGSSRLEDYGIWGTPVLAPAPAKVHVAHDGEPDAEPGVLSANPTRPNGNYVALELETGTYLLICHLQRGSVAVKQGDTVRESDPIGRCGNSGNTSEPHIHIHHQRQDPAKFPTNFAEGLPLFFRDHDGPAMPEGGFEVQGERVVPRGAQVKHVGTARR